MSHPNILEQLRDLVKQKKSKQYYADRLNLTPEEVTELLRELRNLEVLEEESGIHYSQTTTGITLQGRLEEEIGDVEAFLQRQNIDREAWELVRLNQSYHQGAWRFSVQLRPRQSLTYTPEQALARLHTILTEEICPLSLRPTPQSNRKALVVYVADEHVAAAVPEDALYRNEYNGGVYRERKQAILRRILEEVAQQGPFEKLVIVSLGDTLDGFRGQTTRGGHHLPQNMSDRQAFDTYMRVNKEFWDTLAASACAHHYEYHCQTNDNHAGTFGYIANAALETYINARYPQVRTKLYSRFVDHFRLGVHTVMLCHGKDEKHRTKNLPLNLNATAQVFIKDYMDYYKIAPDAGTVHFCKADLHQNASQDGKGFRYRNTLSLFGSSGWVMDNFGYTRAGFSYDIYHLERPEVSEHKVFL